MKVERPRARSSAAPTRENSWRRRGRCGRVRAGTQASRTGRGARSARSGAGRCFSRPCWVRSAGGWRRPLPVFGQGRSRWRRRGRRRIATQRAFDDRVPAGPTMAKARLSSTRGFAPVLGPGEVGEGGGRGRVRPARGRRRRPRWRRSVQHFARFRLSNRAAFRCRARSAPAFRMRVSSSDKLSRGEADLHWRWSGGGGSVRTAGAPASGRRGSRSSR
jgi:hypothetical protein